MKEANERNSLKTLECRIWKCLFSWMTILLCKTRILDFGVDCNGSNVHEIDYIWYQNIEKHGWQTKIWSLYWIIRRSKWNLNSRFSWLPEQSLFTFSPCAPIFSSLMKKPWCGYGQGGICNRARGLETSVIFIITISPRREVSGLSTGLREGEKRAEGPRPCSSSIRENAI